MAIEPIGSGKFAQAAEFMLRAHLLGEPTLLLVRLTLGVPFFFGQERVFRPVPGSVRRIEDARIAFPLAVLPLMHGLVEDYKCPPVVHHGT